MKVMKKQLITAGVIVAVIAGFVTYSIVDDRRRITEKFSEYETACTSFAEFLLQDLSSADLKEASYSISYENDTCRLHRNAGDAHVIIDLSPVCVTYVEQTEKAFERMTGRYSISFIDVSEDQVVFWEEGYGGKLIYASDGSVEKEYKRIDHEYQAFQKINTCWYAVYINAI